jgi:hypothetical protein
MKNIDFTKMNNMLANINWSDLYSIININLAVEKFYNDLLNVINSLIQKVYTNQNKFPTWFSKELRL